MKLIECVPNFSEGRRQDVIQAIANAIKSSPGITLLDVESNPDHNRSVISFVGEPAAVIAAALVGSAKAVELIDLTKHKGEHPRMGAVDVVPFVPLTGATMEDCITLARDFGKEFAEKFHVPVFLYEEATARPERRNLADVRAGEFEGLKEQIGKNPEKKPDFGPDKIHPTAGATAVGAREVLIAYNVNLGSGNVEVAKEIARELRAKDGGLAYVKALGFELKDRGIVQVSMNMTNYRKSQLFKAYELIRLFAERFGVQIVGSEIVGLVPMDALVDSAGYFLKLENFSPEQVLERRILLPTGQNLIEDSLQSFSDKVASKKATPGGGSVSAYMGALAAGLISMVARITLGRKDQPIPAERLNQIVSSSEDLRGRLLRLVVEDSEAFDKVMKAFKLSKEQSEIRAKAIQESIMKAAKVPLSTMENSVQVLHLAEQIAEYGAVNTLSDVTTATAAARSAVEGAASNAVINLSTLENARDRETMKNRVEELSKEASNIEVRITKLVAARTHRP